MNIALYMRLSKEDEELDESRSITTQKMYLNKYIKKFDNYKAFEYIDDGYSGTNFNRPAFKKLIKDIENKKIDVVITKDSSRLGRNVSWVTYYIDEYFPSNKIRYISIDDNYDSNNINSTEMELLTFKTLFNDYYCRDISKKIRSSLKVKKIEGKFTGWKAPYGYKKSIKDKYHLEIDKNVENNIKIIFKLALENNTPSEIARILNNNNIESPSKYIGIKDSKWTSKSIKDILSNETYIGNLTQGKRRKINYKLKQSITIPKEEWIIKRNTHQSIINKELFDIVQEKIFKSKNIKNNKTKNYSLVNLMYCKECSSKIGLNKKNNNLYCVCNNYKKNYKTKSCTPHSYNYLKLEKIIIDEIKKDIPKQYNINSEDIYYELIKKIKLSENGEIELYLNYNSSLI